MGRSRGVAANARHSGADGAGRQSRFRWADWRLLPWVVVIVLSHLFSDTGAAKMDGLRREPVILETASGRHTITAEIADTRASQERGLMFRRTMAADAGMLFLHERSDEVQMWMRNTFMSLDMVFIRADGVVHRIEHGTEPLSERIISSHGEVRAVLELKAGTARALQLAPGDRIVHRFFGTE